MDKGLPNRDFKYIAEESCDKSDNINFTICSYNILAQYLLNDNLHLYKHCDPKILEWPIRWSNIRNDLERLNCDIYCLQEVQCDHYYSDIEPHMKKMGYASFLSRKTGFKKDGCAIFVKQSVFDTELSTFETVTFKNSDVKVLSSDNVGQIALLCPRGRPDSKVCIANTHLLFNPNRGEVKLAEISLMLSKIDAIANSNRSKDRQSELFYWPIVLCGDLNLEPGSLLYRLLVDGRIDINNMVASDASGQNASSFWGRKSEELLSGLSLPPRVGISDEMVLDRGAPIGSGKLSHWLRLRPACEYASEQEARLVTACTSVDACAVDFVFYRHVEAPETLPCLRLAAHLRLVAAHRLREVGGGIPNAQHGSDHIPLVAAFDLLLPLRDRPAET